MKVTHDDVTDFMRRRIQADAERRRREARGVRQHQSEPIARPWSEVYADLARIDADERQALGQLEQEHREWTQGAEAPKRQPVADASLANLRPGAESDPINSELYRKVEDAVLKRFGMGIAALPPTHDGAIRMVAKQGLVKVDRRRRQAVLARIRRLRSKRNATSQA